MTQLKTNIIDKFDNFISTVDYSCISFNRNNIDYTVYSFPYNHDLISLMSSFSHFNCSLFKQYLFLKDFEHFLFDKKHEMVVHVSITADSIQFKVSQSNPKTIVRSSFGLVFVHFDGFTTKNDRYSDFTILFESLYNETLLEIRKVFGSSIPNFKDIADLSSVSTIKYLNNRMSIHQMKAILTQQLQSKYTTYEELSYGYYSVIPITTLGFRTFLQDNFPVDFYSKLKQISSIIFFLDNIFHRSEYPSLLRAFNVVIHPVSKYKDVNKIYSFIISLMPDKKISFELEIYDNGTISFQNSNEHIILTNLDDVYDSVKECLISHIETKLDINRKDITIYHLKLYEMILM